MSIITELSSIQTRLTRYGLPVCFVLGVMGNLLNICVFAQKHLRINSCSIYFINTSIFNFLVMFFGIVPIVYTSYSSYDLASYSVSYCKFRSYMVHVLLMISRFSVALAAFDRFVACSSNPAIRSLNQRHIAIKLVIVICLLWLIIPIHMIIQVNIQMPARRCGGSDVYSFIYGIYAAIVTALPLIIMIIFSYFAIRNLHHVRSRVQATGHTNDRSTARIKKRDIQFILLVVSEVIIYFFSTVLFPVYSIYVAITASTAKDATRVAIENFLRYLTLSFLLYVNSCSIFYVHLVASKAFRQECKFLFCRFYKPNRISHVSYSATGTRNVKKSVQIIYNKYPMDTSYKQAHA